LKLRKRIRDSLDLCVAARRDGYRAAQNIGNLAKNPRHLRSALEIELVRRKFHAVRVAHGLAGLNAQQNFLSVRIFVMQVMAIVGGDQRNTGFFREANEFGVHALLDLHALVLNLKKEIAFAENIPQAVGVRSEERRVGKECRCRGWSEVDIK